MTSTATHLAGFDLPDSLQVEREDDIAIVRLSRPDKRNAIDDSTIRGLGALFAAMPGDIRAVVLCGAGEHFCAGLDLSALAEHSAAEGILHSRMWHRALDNLQFGSAPIVTVMHGATVGGGLELACATHVRVAETSAFYALPEGQRGIFVGGGASVRLPRLIGAHRMADMMFTGRSYNAADGQTLGISTYLEAPGQGLARAKELAHKIATNARATNFALMHALPRIAESGQDSGLFMESLMAAIAQSEPDAKDRMRAFIEKRAAKVQVSP